MKNVIVSGSLCCAWAIAQVAPTTLRVTNETAPPGGMAQIKVLVTSPMPITSGNMAFDMSGVSFDEIDGIALFSNTGDVAGAAVVSGGQISVKFTSPGGTFGANADYPLLTIATTLSKNVLPGQKFPVHLDTSASVWQNLLGAPIAFEFQQGSITVGGSISITNVVPGGGALPAGGQFSILGIGFSPRTKVSVRGVNASSIQYVSPTEIRVTLREAGTLDGALIQVQNPDNSTDSYYSYLRGVPLGESTRGLLAKTVPVFSINTAFEAVLPPLLSPLVNADYFTAIALQNPGPSTAAVTVESHASGGDLTGSTVLSLPPGMRISREVSELFGTVLPTGSYLHLTSAQPVQMLGLLGNDRTGVVLPIPVNVLNAPASPPVVPDSGVGGKGR